MKKFAFLIGVFWGVVFFAGCGGEVVEVHYEDENLKAHEFFVEGEEYYFLYPESAEISGERVEFSEGECDVINFGNFERLKDIAGGRDDLEDVLIDRNNLRKGTVELWKVDDFVVLYGWSMRESDFGVWAFFDARDISSCKAYVDDIFDSLTDKVSYMQEQYGFEIEAPADFEPEYFENGIFFRNDVGDYVVGIGAKSFENETDYRSVVDYVTFEYPGYDVELFETDNVGGYFVDVAEGEDAFRHFFTLSDDGRTVYEIYLMLPGQYFSEYLEDLNFAVNSLRIFR